MNRKRNSHRAPRGSKSAGSDLQIAYGFFNEIGIIGQLSSNQMQRAMPHDLTQSQFSVLNWFVRVDTQATPGRLAKAFQVTKGAMTNTLHKLKAICRSAPPHRNQDRGSRRTAMAASLLPKRSSM